jgi:8-oxo-dGTP pyrophosphatase MutT (NUDIX family)
MAPQKSCGFLIVRGDPVREFLLMRHKDRWDLPKGHVDPGETEMQCALRELHEETGLAADEIQTVDGFRFTLEYPVRNKRTGQIDDKSLVVFLARARDNVEIRPTEHLDYRWFPWQPPHRIQTMTIDPLLSGVEEFLASAR